MLSAKFMVFSGGISDILKGGCASCVFADTDPTQNIFHVDKYVGNIKHEHVSGLGIRNGFECTIHFSIQIYYVDIQSLPCIIF